MKKLILSAVLLAGLSFVACSKDDDKGSSRNCVTCDVDGTSQDIDICRSSYDTQEQYEDAIDIAEMVGNCN